MSFRIRLVSLSFAGLALVSPALADGITGAGSGSNGGSLTGKTNENTQMMKTGADNGGEAVPSKQDRTGVGTGDNAVLNAPRETVPGTMAPSNASNLNGQSAKP